MHLQEVESGKQVGRGNVYVVAHKHKDGSYVNDEAKEIAISMPPFLFTLVSDSIFFSFKLVTNLTFMTQYPLVIGESSRSHVTRFFSFC